MMGISTPWPRTQVILSSQPANVGDGIGREEPLA